MPPTADTPARPNLVFITVDQMRGDCLGVDGHPIVETPNLDTMANDGVRFSRSYCVTPSCIPSRASMLTGLRPRSNGRVGYEDGVPWNFQTTLPGELAKAGYHTQGVGKMHFYPPRSLMGFHNVRLHDGFLHIERNANQRLETVDDYLPWLREKLGGRADYTSHGLDCNSWVARPWHLDESLHPTNWVVSESMDFLNRRDPRRPFFLWMSFVRPHAPLDPPQAYWDMYVDRDIPMPPVGDWAKSFPHKPGAIRMDAFEGRLDDRMLRRARAAYYALITHIDHQIGRFLGALHEHNLLDSTLLVFTSDHGDLLGDHNLFRKALPYEGSARVPLIAYAPPQFDMGLDRGAVVDGIVENTDILPTLLDVAGVDIPESIEGRSLLPTLRGQAPSPHDYIHGEHTLNGESAQFLTDGSEKYIWFSGDGREQLFDMAADPEELHDLSTEAAAEEKLGRWRAILVKELEGREEGMSDGKRLITGRPVKPCLSHIL